MSKVIFIDLVNLTSKCILCNGELNGELNQLSKQVIKGIRGVIERDMRQWVAGIKLAVSTAIFQMAWLLSPLARPWPSPWSHCLLVPATECCSLCQCERASLWVCECEFVSVWVVSVPWLLASLSLSHPMPPGPLLLVVETGMWSAGLNNNNETSQGEKESIEPAYGFAFDEGKHGQWRLEAALSPSDTMHQPFDAAPAMITSTKRRRTHAASPAAKSSSMIRLIYI